MSKLYNAVWFISVSVGGLFSQVPTLTPNIGLAVPSTGQQNYQVQIDSDLYLLDRYLSGGLGLPALSLAYQATPPAGVANSSVVYAAQTDGRLYLVTPASTSFQIPLRGATTFTNGDCLQFDSNGNIIDAGVTCTSISGYVITPTFSGIAKAVTSSNTLQLAVPGTDYQVPITAVTTPSWETGSVASATLTLAAGTGKQPGYAVQTGTTGVVALSSPTVVEATSYNFTPQAPGGTLTASTPATVTLTPCPFGLNGTDSAHYLWVSAGTGIAEGVLINGGSCTSGAGSGTITFTPLNNHSGAWTVSSATAGIQEAFVGGGNATVESNPSTATINAAATIPTNSILRISPGTYTFGNTGQLVLSAGATLTCAGGPNNTFFNIPSTYSLSLSPVVLASGSGLQTAQGCSEYFVQPSGASSLGAMTQYAAAIEATGAPRVRIRNWMIVQAWVGIDLTGTTGGSTVDDLQISSYGGGILINGALDTITLSKIHAWPFGLSSNNLTAYNNAANYGVYTGRCDDLKVSDSFWNTGTGIVAYLGSGGGTTGLFSNVQLDQNSGLLATSGDLEFGSSRFSPGATGAQAVNVGNGAHVTITGSQVIIGAALTNAAIAASGVLTDLKISNSYLESAGFDVIHAQAGSSARMTLIGNTYNRNSGIAYTQPTIQFLTTSRGHVEDSTNVDVLTGSGVFVNIANDDYYFIVANMLVGWTLSGGCLPSSCTTAQVALNR